MSLGISTQYLSSVH